MASVNYRLVLACNHRQSVGHGRFDRVEVGGPQYCQTCEAVSQIVEKVSFPRGGEQT